MQIRAWAVAAATSTILMASMAAPAQERKAVEVLSFDREVKPILRKRCANCHNTERPRGELDLTTYAGVMAGGAGGKAAVAGNPGESTLYTLAAHVEDPKMPPNAPKIPQREIDTIRRWIEGGLIEKAGDAPSPVVATGVPAPTLVPPEVPAHLAAVSALAVSPTAPIAAVSGHRQVLVFDLGGRKLLGALPFPEGDVFVLKFSGDGRTLLASGGTGSESGRAILFRTEDWSRASALGDEVDAVLAADLSADSARVVIGGPSRAVKLIANPGGAVEQTFRKSTDWVTAAAFSPDGLLVAAGDRFGGLFLWETRSGQDFLALKGHPKAITSIGWDPKGDRLFSAGEDGSIQAWDLHSGKVAARWDAHPGGVLSIAVHPSGRIASAGRDRRIKVWEADGKLAGEFGPAAGQATRVAWSADGQSLVSGDLAGEVRVWSLADSSSVALPIPVASRPSAVALVAPVLSPARPFAPKPATIAARPSKPDAPTRVGDDLEAALASAREAAAAAERAVAGLARLSRSRAEGTPSSGDALNSANAAATALRDALLAEPSDPGLSRALEETERAIKVLEQKRGRLNAARVSTGGDR